MTATLPALGRAGTRRRDLLRGLGATIALLAFVVGVPIALIALAPSYTPSGVGSLADAWDMLTAPDDGTVLFAVVASVAWICWAVFTASVVVELVASARRVAAPRLRLVGGIQSVATRLVATASILLSLSATSIAVHPGPAAAAPLTRVVTPESPSGTTRPIDEHEGTPASQQHRQAAAALPTITVHRGDTLWGIAERHLGAGTRYTEIRDLNLHRPQPDGHALVDTDWINPGWILRLPADATGLPAAAAAAAADAEAVVTVRSGDTLWSIAEHHLGDGARYVDLVELNRDRPQADGERLTDPDLIRPGWTLVLPSAVSPARPAPAPTQTRSLPAQPPTPAAEPVAPSPGNHTAREPEPSRAQAEMPNDTTETETRPDGSAQAPWFLGLAGLTAVGVVAELTRRRFLQQRARRIGETIPMPEPGTAAAAAERTLRDAAPDSIGIETITATLTRLARRYDEKGMDLPRIAAVLLRDDRFRVLLTDDGPEPEPPFRRVDARTWDAPAGALESTRDDEDDSWVPYPLLGVLGHTDTDTVILNLEAAGTLTISGDLESGSDAIRALAVELATSPLSRRLSVMVDDDLADLVDAFETHRMRTGERDTPQLQTDAIARYLTSIGCDDTLQARGDHQPEDAWLPVAFVGTSYSGAPGPWSGAVLVTAGEPRGGWTLEVAPDGTANLSPLDLALRVQRLHVADADALTSLLRTALPPAPTSRVEHTTMDVVAFRDAYSEPPADDRTESASVIVRVLGPVEIDGLPVGVGQLRPRVKELLVYLALHGPTTATDLDDALWGGARVNAHTRNMLVYRARQAVGEDVLPRREDGRYALADTVTADWTVFRSHVATAASAADEEARIRELTAALDLVRERPFRGLRGNEYAWADLDAQLMSSAIADAALVLSALHHDAGHDTDALATAIDGLRTEPYSEALQSAALAAAPADDANELRRAFERALEGLE